MGMGSEMTKQKALVRLRNRAFFSFSLRNLFLVFAALTVLFVCFLKFLDSFVHVISPKELNYNVVRQYASAAEKFVKAKGSFPVNADELLEFYVAPPWLEKSPKKSGSAPVDFFGGEIFFSSETDRLILGSLGRDGKAGGKSSNEDFVFAICINKHGDVWVEKQTGVGSNKSADDSGGKN